MTFKDDFCRIHFSSGHKNITCDSLKIGWPPPKIIDFGGFNFKRIRYSQITDKQRNGMTHVIRGAEYQPVKQVEQV